jgi:hypothetical protein
MSASKAGEPVFIYETKERGRQLAWHKNHKLGDKIVILKWLKQLAADTELAKDIAKFETWKQDPGFPDDQEER